MTYKEYKDKRQEEFNALPIFYAFGRKQFKEAMEARGLTEDDTDKIYSIGAGGYYLKKDAQIIRDYFNKPDDLKDLMRDKQFAEDAFYYEMANHEYHINWQGDWDVASCFGSVKYKEGAPLAYYLLEMGYSSDTVTAAKRAAQRFFKDAEENGWW